MQDAIALQLSWVAVCGHDSHVSYSLVGGEARRASSKKGVSSRVARRLAGMMGMATCCCPCH